MNAIKLMGASVALAAVFAAATASSASDNRNTLLPDGYHHYIPSVVPDRIVLVPTATPEHSQTVNWRTEGNIDKTVAEITKATGHPGLHLEARRVTGESRTLASRNGLARHHSVTFDNLEPNTLYAYRVKGGDSWSEWLQFRTPKAGFEPYRILYFGDAQNAVKSHFSRVLRQAQLTAPDAALMIHAGDLVSGRDGVHDDEWGEWFDAGGWLFGMTNQIASPGNHEYIKQESGLSVLMPHWPAQFSVADNGPDGMKDSVFFVDYQGVRYIALDSQAALQDEGNARLQAAWLEDVLKNNKAQWTIVVHHHPTYSVSQGRDNPLLRELWQPLYEKYGVHLVLQGHDHTYGRARNPQAGNEGPVYVVSVAGPKMYRVSSDAKTQMDRTAEDRQLFQIIGFEKNRLTYRSLTATGELYDAFDLVRKRKGVKLEDRRPDTDDAHCGNPNPPKETRCWAGTELINATAPQQ